MTTTRRLGPAVAAGLGSLLLSGCWPMPSANPDRTGHNAFETTLTGATVGDLTEQWRYPSPVAGQPVSAPVTSAGGVHVTVSCGLFTLDPGTGALRWAQPIPAQTQCELPIPTAHPGEPFVVDTPQGQRVVGSYGAALTRPPGSILAVWATRAFDPVTGTPDTPDSSISGFVVAARGAAQLHSAVQSVAPFAAGRVVTVDGHSWTLHSGPNSGDLSPARGMTLGTDLVYHAGFAVASTTPGEATFGDGVRAYARSGPAGGCGPVPGVTPVSVACPTWFTPTDGAPTAPVLHAASNTLLTRTPAGTLYALDAATGAVRWTSPGHGSGAAPVVVGDHLWLGTGTGQVQGFPVTGCGAPTCGPSGPSLDTGTGQPVTGLAAAGDDLVFATSGGQVHAFGPCGAGACEPLWSGAGTGTPAVSDGRLFVTDGPDLVAYGLP